MIFFNLKFFSPYRCFVDSVFPFFLTLFFSYKFPISEEEGWFGCHTMHFKNPQYLFQKSGKIQQYYHNVFFEEEINQQRRHPWNFLHCLRHSHWVRCFEHYIEKIYLNKLVKNQSNFFSRLCEVINIIQKKTSSSEKEVTAKINAAITLAFAGLNF